MPSFRSTVAAVILAVGVAAGIAATPAHAVLVHEGLFTPGDQFVARDTDSGLQWLDLRLTLGLSYNAVVGGALGPFAPALPPGGWYALGFRHATVAQVTTLYTNAGAVIPESTELLDPITLAPTPGFLAVQELLAKLGNTVFNIFNQPQPFQ
jgi:hypothetical protein